MVSRWSTYRWSMQLKLSLNFFFCLFSFCCIFFFCSPGVSCLSLTKRDLLSWFLPDVQIMLCIIATHSLRPVKQQTKGKAVLLDVTHESLWHRLLLCRLTSLPRITRLYFIVVFAWRDFGLCLNKTCICCIKAGNVWVQWVWYHREVSLSVEIALVKGFDQTLSKL